MLRGVAIHALVGTWWGQVGTSRNGGDYLGIEGLLFSLLEAASAVELVDVLSQFYNNHGMAQ